MSCHYTENGSQVSCERNRIRNKMCKCKNRLLLNIEYTQTRFPLMYTANGITTCLSASRKCSSLGTNFKIFMFKITP